jgi:hypothetical protein
MKSVLEVDTRYVIPCLCVVSGDAYCSVGCSFAEMSCLQAGSLYLLASKRNENFKLL